MQRRVGARVVVRQVRQLVGGGQRRALSVSLAAAVRAARGDDMQSGGRDW